MTDKQHPADAAGIEKIAQATHFNVHLRKGPAEKINREAKTLADAIRVADELGKTASGKAAMIYAVTPEKMTVHVPTDMIEEARKDAAEAKGLTAIEYARLSAIITGGGYKRSNSKAAVEARFIKIATEAGIANAADLANGPFDMAEHVIREKLAGKALTIAGVKAMPTPDETPLPEIDTAMGISRKPVRVRAVPVSQAKISVDQLFSGDPLGMKAARKARDGAAPAAPKAKAGKNAGSKAKRAIVVASGRPMGRRAEIAENAAKGVLPPAPDFSAETHRRFRGKLAEIVKLAEAGDVAALKAIEIKTYSSSPKAMARYRDLAVMAIEAKSTPAPN